MSLLTSPSCRASSSSAYAMLSNKTCTNSPTESSTIKWSTNKIELPPLLTAIQQSVTMWCPNKATTPKSPTPRNNFSAETHINETRKELPQNVRWKVSFTKRRPTQHHPDMLTRQPHNGTKSPIENNLFIHLKCKQEYHHDTLNVQRQLPSSRIKHQLWKKILITSFRSLPAGSWPI